MLTTLRNLALTIGLVVALILSAKSVLESRDHRMPSLEEASFGYSAGAESETATSAAAAANAVTVMAVGDIACGKRTASACKHVETSDVVLRENPDAVLTLGDTQYECGELDDFNEFFDPSWGRFKEKIRPAIGNHEYQVPRRDDGEPNVGKCPYATPGAPGYFTYFGAAANPQDPLCQARCAGYYSWDLGEWHFIVLNDQCSQRGAGGCDPTSPQYAWLLHDLATHQNQCTIAYWHTPRYSSGRHGNHEKYVDFWQALYAAGVDIVLNGHDHDYERFAPQDPHGNLDPDYGIRAFVVGTGGRNLTSESEETGLLPNSEVFDHSTFGVLKLTLRPGNYDWEFVPIEEPGTKQFTDKGTGTCHGAPPVKTVPGTPVAATPVTQPLTCAMPAVAGDDFAAGLSRWAKVEGLTVERGPGSPSTIVRARSSSGATYARMNLGGAYSSLTYRLRFNVLDQGDASFNLLKVRTVDDKAILGVYVAADGSLGYRNDVAKIANNGRTYVTKSTWHDLVVQVTIGERGDDVSIWLDGQLVTELTGSAELGSAPIGWIQLGENSSGPVYEVLFADVQVNGFSESATGTPVASPVASPIPSADLPC